MKKQIFAAAAILPFLASAEIVLTSPVGGKLVPLLSENQKQLKAMPSHQARLELLTKNKKENRKGGYFERTLVWQRALPVEFSWKCTAGEKGPFTIEISETPDFKAVQYAYSKKDSTKVPVEKSDANFKVGQKYYWKVTADKGSISSKAGTFTTEPDAPRWITLDGRTRNVRDLGGYMTSSGKRVKQGMLFRGQGLNDNSGDKVHPGKNRLMISDVELLCGRFGIKTDLDLRSQGEVAGMQTSPLGKNVNFINNSSSAYLGIHQNQGKKVMAQNFKVLCDRRNYPIYFHCIGGWDRTGALAFVANGVLGVSENELAFDWELTTLPKLPDMPPADKWRDYNGMVKGFQQYGKPGDSLQILIEKYLLSIGITQKDIADFRDIMLEK